MCKINNVKFLQGDLFDAAFHNQILTYFDKTNNLDDILDNFHIYVNNQVYIFYEIDYNRTKFDW